jgi:hypothetical protein
MQNGSAELQAPPQSLRGRQSLHCDKRALRIDARILMMVYQRKKAEGNCFKVQTWNWIQAEGKNEAFCHCAPLNAKQFQSGSTRKIVVDLVDRRVPEKGG